MNSGELTASSLALTLVLRREKIKAPLLFTLPQLREGGRLSPCPLPSSRPFVALSWCQGKLLSLAEGAGGRGCPAPFHGHAGNQGKAALLNSRPVIPANKQAQEGAVE